MIILVGASASGKTELAKFLVQYFGYQKCITTTTRNPRSHETDGIDYHFLSRNQFEQRISEEAFLEVTTYQNQYYGIQKKDVCLKGIVIVDPKGANTLIEQLGKKVFVVFVETDKSLRMMRMKERGDNSIAVENRLASDDLVFHSCNISRIDLHIINDNHTLEELAIKMDKDYRDFMNNT